MGCPYANTSILLGLILLALTFLSMPVPQLRVIFHDIRLTGGGGLVLIALGIFLGSLGFCGVA
jgi:hypothetical protein